MPGAKSTIHRIASDHASSAETLAQRAHRELRAALMRGDFLPGTALTLRGLAERLGTSIMPVREAVSRLAAEQALELQPNRAIVVPELSRREIDELWRIRCLIESDAAAIAAEVATGEEVDRMAEITDGMWQALRRRDVHTFVEGTGLWAMQLAKASHSEPFMGYIRTCGCAALPISLRPSAAISRRKTLLLVQPAAAGADRRSHPRA